MGKKGRPSLAQLQAKNLQAATKPDPQKLYEGTRQKYEETARELLTNSPGFFEQYLNLKFGSKFVGDLAFALDPTSGFLASNSLIADTTRFVETPEFETPFDNRYQARTHVQEFRNWDEDQNIVEEYLYDEFDFLPDDTNANCVFQVPSSHRYDTTFKDRGKDTPFGLFDMRRITWTDTFPNAVNQYNDQYVYINADNTMYNRTITVNTVFYPGGAIGLPEFDPIVTYDGVSDPITISQGTSVLKLLAKVWIDRRVWNPWYQLAELRDLPKLVKQITDLRDLLMTLSSLPSGKTVVDRVKSIGNTNLHDLDKGVANQYLGYEFGYKSTIQAVQQALELPSRTAKKLNYLLRKVGKRTTGRTSEYREIPKSSKPALTLNLPGWVDASDVRLLAQSDSMEHKLVACQELKFPQSVVPGVADFKQFNLAGAMPTLKDIYDSIPWTWLVDWFSDLGDYIGAISAIQSSNSFVSYGFMTSLYDQTYTYTGTLKVQDSVSVQLYADDEVQETLTDRSIPVSLVLAAHHHVRRRVTDLNGVGSLDGQSTQWTDYQWNIIASLLAKYWKR